MKSQEYDTIIIGAGIGGLVCGCYLAKAGMKVLIVEQHNKTGGYCTSFNRKGFTFEAGAIEDLSDGSFFGKIVDELGIDKKIDITRHSPNLLIFTPEERIRLGITLNEIIEYFQKLFPSEGYSVERFFKFIAGFNITLIYFKYKDKNFNQLLDEYFINEKLKIIFRMILSQIGAASNKVSALAAITYYKTFVLGGGYYPRGGLQKFSDCFASRFKELGGEIMLSSLVEKIIVDKGKTSGIVLNSGIKILANFVVSNVDVIQTFVKLIGEVHLDKNFIAHIKKLIPSVSAFIVYLGISKILRKQFENCHEIWSISSCTEDHFKKFRLEKGFSKINIYCYLPSFRDASMAPSNCESISLCVFTPPMEREYWESKRDFFAEQIIDRMSKVLSFTKEDIIVKATAIPQTLHRYTLNTGGAFKGWAPIVGQVDISTMPSKTQIKNFYLVGHWVTTGAGESGVPQAVFSGHKVSQLILKAIEKI